MDPLLTSLLVCLGTTNAMSSTPPPKEETPKQPRWTRATIPAILAHSRFPGDQNFRIIKDDPHVRENKVAPDFSVYNVISVEETEVEFLSEEFSYDEKKRALTHLKEPYFTVELARWDESPSWFTDDLEGFLTFCVQHNVMLQWAEKSSLRKRNWEECHAMCYPREYFVSSLFVDDLRMFVSFDPKKFRVQRNPADKSQLQMVVLKSGEVFYTSEMRTIIPYRPGETRNMIVS